MERVKEKKIASPFLENERKGGMSVCNIAYTECLRGEPLVTVALSSCSDAFRRTFLRECQGFLLEFLKVLNQSAYAKSGWASSLSCFSPDMMLLGDESYAVVLFKDLTTYFWTVGVYPRWIARQLLTSLNLCSLNYGDGTNGWFLLSRTVSLSCVIPGYWTVV